MNWRKQVEVYETQIIQWRRDLHQIPEVGLYLPKTADYISRELEKMGIQCRRNVGGSSLIGLIQGGKEGKTIALRADMDALAIKEETGLEYASANDNMHACGHDAHSAILLGAARVLQDHREQLRGNVKLLFQAAEEGPGGARLMIQEGALENPAVSAVMGLHVGTVYGELKTGMVGISYGKMMACMDRFVFNVKGKGCHGAYPDKGVDPIVMAAQLIGALQILVSREVKPTEPAVITVGRISGGRAFNIIPDAVEVEGTVRAGDQQVRDHIATRMLELAEGTAKSMGGWVDLEYSWGHPPLENDPEFTRQFVQSALKVVEEYQLLEIRQPVMGGEDMAYFLKAVPGTFFFLGSAPEVDGTVYPHHSSRFQLDEKVFVTGSALLVQGTVDWLESQEE